MLVLKRDGRRETVKFDKITTRIHKLCYGLNIQYINPVEVAKKVIQGLYDGVTTVELDGLAAEISATMSSIHPDYATLASRIAISNLHKITHSSFTSTMKRLYTHIDPHKQQNIGMISKDLYTLIDKNAATLDNYINYERDYELDYFGFKTLERSYLLRINGKIVERPQDLFMRVALGIHLDDLEAALKSYDLMTQKWFTHATPTLFNAGTPKPQMSSCFLMAMQEDSIAGIYDTLKQCALISQSAGGIGLSIHNIRSQGAHIRGTNGTSNGIIPMIKVFNDTARYVDQGGGKRKGAFAIYLEPWHPDIFEFLDLKKNHGKDELRARDLFYALWVSDLFMERVKQNKDWSLFDPDECPGLPDCYGKQFRKLYTNYESEGKAKKTVKARDLWYAILESQIETGTPYMLYKDASNEKSNQKNIGTIKCSNLCTEVLQYSSPEEVAVCNLASISLPKFVQNCKFDHQKLYEVTKTVTQNLNKIIDRNYYPVPEAKYSNFKHRPIGIGVQGLADLFMLLRYPFESAQARKLNKEIFETMYFAAVTASKDLALQEGTYETYEGSPISQGIFQFDMWNVRPDSGRWNWKELKKQVKKYGVRNSLLLAPMPTASTSQILGNNECFEPYTSNIYTRRVLSGEFIIVNKHLLRDLIRLNLWNNDLKNRLIAENGSVQNIPRIPQEIKQLYKTAWEINQKSIINMAVDRGAYICQSQSMNIFMKSASLAKMTSMHFYAWKSGLKTGMYYLRTQAAVDAIKFTIDKQTLDQAKEQTQRSCDIDGTGCLVCSG